MQSSRYAESEPASPITNSRADASTTDSKPLPPLPKSVEKPSPTRPTMNQKEPRGIPYTRPMYSTPHTRKVSREQQSARSSDMTEGTPMTTPDTAHTNDVKRQSAKHFDRDSTLGSSPIDEPDTPSKSRKSVSKSSEKTTPSKRRSTSKAELIPGEPGGGLAVPLIAKKVLSPRGKPYMIRIPVEPSGDTPRRNILSWSQYALRLEEFVKAGYNVSGGSDESVHTKEPDDRLLLHHGSPPLHQRDSSPYPGVEGPVVAIPDKKVWETYRSSLVEAKLIALGVVPAGEGTTGEVAPRSMSRKGSSPFPGIATSPPPLSGSASSQRNWVNTRMLSDTFSPTGFTNHSSTATAASPVSSIEPTMAPTGRSGHQPLQSTVISAIGNPAIHPSLQQQLPTRTADTLSKSFSPFRPDIMSRGPSALSQASPDSVSGSRQTSRLPHQMVAMNQDLPERNQRSLDPSPDPETPKPRAPSLVAPSRVRAQSYGLLTQPTPKGHRHNISESLEREAEKEQYYPGEYVDESAALSQTPARSQPKPLSSQSQPSTLHKPTGSKSSFNVNAPEFHFDPGSAHTRHIPVPRNPSVPNVAMAGAMMGQPAISLVTAHTNGQVTGGSMFDVNAPPFKPRNQISAAPPSSAFDFSARKPEAQPLPQAQREDTPGVETPMSAKIFDGINFSDTGKSSKGSRAVSIQKPGSDSPRASNAEPQEDEDGRITQDIGRHKRGRMSRKDDDDVPQFAQPSSPLPLAARAEPEADVPGSSPPTPLINFEDHLQTSDLPNREALAPEEEGEASWSDYGIDSPRRKSSSRKKGTGVSQSTVREIANAAKLQAQNDVLPALVPSPKKKPETPMEKLQASLQEDMVASDYLEENLDFAAALMRSNSHKTTQKMVDKQNGMNSVGVDGNFKEPVLTAYKTNTTGVRSPRPSTDWLQTPDRLRGIASPIRKLNGNHETEVSDWDDFLSDRDEQKFLSQAQFSDTKVKGLIEAVLQQHLRPLQKSLRGMNGTSRTLPNNANGASPTLHVNDKSSSDADDEEDGQDSRGPNRPHSSSARSQKQLDAIQAAVREAMATSGSSATTEQLEKQVRLRSDAEQRAEDLQKLLTLSEREIVLFKESSDNHDHQVHKLREERHDAEQRVSSLEKIERELRTRASALASETTTLESTLEEYRTSSNKWRQEIDSVKEAREELQQVIDELRRDIDDREKIIERSNREIDHHREKHASVATRLQQVEDTVIATTRQLQGERESWRRKDEEQSKSLAVHRTRLEEEFKLRQRLERDVDRQGVHERSAIKATVSLEEIRNSNTRLSAELARLRDEATAERNAAALHERQAIEAKDIARAEIQRTKTLLEAEIEVVNTKAENRRVDLETRLAHVRDELEAERLQHAAMKHEHGTSLEAAHHQRIVAVREAADSANAARAEERQRFEQLTADLSKQHASAMQAALDAQQSTTSHLTDSLKLSQEKHALLEDKIAHLEDKVAVAQSAAAAAAASAQQQQQSSASQAAANAAAATKAQAQSTAEKATRDSQRISPQALRESIMVLQEQLQERESRIDALTTSLSAVPQDLPAKYADRVTEITWLRELLNVRLDDLSELCQLLGLENFDQDAARDAAIRIRANLQMEAQERDRLAKNSGRDLSVGVGVGDSTPKQTSNPLPSLADIQGFATPKAAQLAAAWGNWRRGSTSTARPGQSPGKQPANGTARPNTSSSNAGSASSTPSRLRTAQRPPFSSQPSATSAQAKTQSFLSGLMTPPASNMRRTPVSRQHQQQPRRSPAKQPTLRQEVDEVEEDDYNNQQVQPGSDYNNDDNASSIGGEDDAQPLPLNLEMELAGDDGCSDTDTQHSSPSKISSAKRNGNGNASGLSPAKPRTPPRRKQFADDEREGAREHAPDGGSVGVGDEGVQTAAGTRLEPFGGVLR